MKNEAKSDSFMHEAIELSIKNVANGGGPFGAVIARGNEVIAVGYNTVTPDNDPTAHAEVNAIRHACRKLGTFDLSGCTIYSSCEPCPMCLSAIYWAKIDKLVYANTQADADAIGFSDQFLYEELARDPKDRKLPTEQKMRDEALAAFKAWEEKEDKTEY